MKISFLFSCQLLLSPNCNLGGSFLQTIQTFERIQLNDNVVGWVLIHRTETMGLK